VIGAKRNVEKKARLSLSLVITLNFKMHQSQLILFGKIEASLQDKETVKELQFFF